MTYAQIYDWDNLYLAWRKAHAGSGAERFEMVGNHPLNVEGAQGLVGGRAC